MLCDIYEANYERQTDRQTDGQAHDLSQADALTENVLMISFMNIFFCFQVCVLCVLCIVWIIFSETKGKNFAPGAKLVKNSAGGGNNQFCKINIFSIKVYFSSIRAFCAISSISHSSLQ